MILRALPVLNVGRNGNKLGNVTLARRVHKGKTLEKRKRTRKECSNGIRIRDFKEQLCLRMERTSDRVSRKTI
jgi:hypothetical protein